MRPAIAWLLAGASVAAGLAGCEGGDAPADAELMADAGAPVEPCSALDPRADPAEPFLGPEGLRERLVDWIGGAETTLDVAIYQIDAPAVVEALEAAHERGARLRVLADAEPEVNVEALDRLRAVGAEVREAPTRFEFFHPKYLLRDGSEAIVTSANFNRFSMQTERNHGVVLRDRWDVEDLAALFELDWSEGSAPATLHCTRLVISPNNARERIEALIDDAEAELRVQHLSLTDERTREALAARVDAGVRVRVVLADPAWIESNAESAAALRDAGVEVRFLRSLDNHAKLVVADDRAAFVGSENLSWTSLERNREVGVLVGHGGAVDTLREAFDADWEVSTP